MSKGLVVALGLAAFVGVSAIYDGWVVSLLWNWFITPFGVVRLTIPWAIGLSCVKMSWLGAKGAKEGQDQWEAIGEALGLITFALIIGWVAHFFM